MKKIRSFFICAILIGCLFQLPISAYANGFSFCPHCGKPINPDYIFCPYCSAGINVTLSNPYTTPVEPVALISLRPFHTEFEFSRQSGITLKDKLGNTYFDCLEYESGSGGLTDHGFIGAKETFVLHRDYSRFSGTLFVPEERISDFDDICNYYFKIYGDGKLLYASPNMVSTQYPVKFSVPLSGIDKLVLEWNGGDGVFFSIPVGLADAYLYK